MSTPSGCANWRVALLFCFLVSLPLLAQAQPTNFTVRVNAQLVVQTVTITDKDGKPVEGLVADDFVLTEDNVLQTISVFEFEKYDDTISPRPSPRIPALAVERGPVQPPATRITPVPPGDSRYQDRR